MTCIFHGQKGCSVLRCSICPFLDVCIEESEKEILKVGDTIACHDADDMVDYMTALANNGIETDFVYEKDGVKGYWLEVTEVK